MDVSLRLSKDQQVPKVSPRIPCRVPKDYPRSPKEGSQVQNSPKGRHPGQDLAELATRFEHGSQIAHAAALNAINAMQAAQADGCRLSGLLF